MVKLDKQKAAHFAALGRYAGHVKKLARKAAREEQKAMLKSERSVETALEKQERYVNVARRRLRSIANSPSVRGAKLIGNILRDPLMPADVKAEAGRLMLSWEQGDSVYASKKKRRREDITASRLRLER